jgi:nitric oxide reductase NorQ protein
MDSYSYTVGTKFTAEGSEWEIVGQDLRKSSKGRNVRVFTLRNAAGATKTATSRGLTLWLGDRSKPVPMTVVSESKFDAPEVKPAVAVEIKMDRGVFVPEIKDDYYITPDINGLFRRIAKTSSVKTQKVLLLGPHGAGKTELAMQFAARTGKPMLIMDCANLREPRDWFGYKTIEAGQVVWHESQFDKVLAAGDHVVLLDEANRVHPSIMNTLIPILDGRGFTYLEEKGGCIKVAPGTVFFSTMNEGAVYTGTNASDAALRSRLGQRIVEVSYLPKDKEVEVLVSRTGISDKDAKSLVDIANQIRKKSTGIGSSFSDGFSTRQLIACAEDFAVDGAESLTFTMTNLFSSEGGTNSERAAVLQLIQGKFGVVEAAKDDSSRRIKGVA